MGSELLVVVSSEVTPVARALSGLVAGTEADRGAKVVVTPLVTGLAVQSLQHLKITEKLLYLDGAGIAGIRTVGVVGLPIGGSPVLLVMFASSR